MIRAGRVSVDGEPAHLGQKIDPDTARVLIDGLPLPVRPDLVHYLLNKPRGVLCTASDPQGRTTVIDLVPTGTRVYPAGRLDADSEGLIVVTNDGDLAATLTHPRHGVTKTYLAQVAGDVGKGALRRLVDGVDLEDGPAAARDARVVGAHRGTTLVEVVMGEGRNREVRRMFDAIGHPVERLTRVAIGPLRDRRLRPGAWRRLTAAEIRSLHEVGGAAT